MDLEKEAVYILKRLNVIYVDSHVEFVMASLRAVHDEARVEGAHAEFNAHRLGFIEGVNEALETAGELAYFEDYAMLSEKIRTLKITEDEL